MLLWFPMLEIQLKRHERVKNFFPTIEIPLNTFEKRYHVLKKKSIYYVPSLMFIVWIETSIVHNDENSKNVFVTSV